MNAIVDTKPSQPSESVLTDILLRIYVAGAITFFALAALSHWRSNPERISLLFVAITETITAGIIICSRRAQRRDWRPLSVIASFISMSYLLALSLSPGKHLFSEQVGVSLQVAGLAMQLYAKLSLGRSFGVLPATRLLVTRGAYRWVRHPIYFGYLIAHTGFLVSNFSLQNLAVFVVLYLAQLVRIFREEEMLLELPGYYRYRDTVRYRLIPYLF